MEINMKPSILSQYSPCVVFFFHRLKKKSQSVDITAPGFNPLGGAGKQAPQASKAPAPKTPIIEEEENNSANTQKHPPRKSELKRFYTIGECRFFSKWASAAWTAQRMQNLHRSMMPHWVIVCLSDGLCGHSLTWSKQDYGRRKTPKIFSKVR